MEKFFVASLLIAALVLVGCAVFQWLWNCTMPAQFGMKPLRYWVAFRLLLIAAFLFSGGFFKMNLTPSKDAVTVAVAPSSWR